MRKCALPNAYIYHFFSKRPKSLKQFPNSYLTRLHFHWLNLHVFISKHFLSKVYPWTLRLYSPSIQQHCNPIPQLGRSLSLTHTHTKLFSRRLERLFFFPLAKGVVLHSLNKCFFPRMESCMKRGFGNWGSLSKSKCELVVPVKHHRCEDIHLEAPSPGVCVSGGVRLTNVSCPTVLPPPPPPLLPFSKGKPNKQTNKKQKHKKQKQYNNIKKNIINKTLS